MPITKMTGQCVFTVEFPGTEMTLVAELRVVEVHAPVTSTHADVAEDHAADVTD